MFAEMCFQALRRGFAKACKRMVPARRPRSRSQYLTRQAVEDLETRVLLTYDVSLDLAGVLTVTQNALTPGDTSDLHVSETNLDGYKFEDLGIAFNPATGTNAAAINSLGNSFTVSAGAVTKIIIDTGDGDDVISLDTFEDDVADLTVTGGAEVNDLVNIGPYTGGTDANVVLNVTQIVIKGDVTTKGTGAQTYNGAVALATNVTLTSATGDITFTGTIDSATDITHYGLTVNTVGGNSFFGDGDADYIGKKFALATLTVDGLNTYVNIAPSAAATPSVTTDADQIYKDKYFLKKDTYLTSTTGNIQFDSTIDSADDLTHYGLSVSTPAGNSFFGNGDADYVGGTFALSFLTVDGLNTYINITPSTTATPSVTTDADQIYKDKYFLKKDTYLISTNGNIQFDSTIDSADDLTHYGLSVATPAGNSFFGNGDADYVGGTFALSFLTVDGLNTYINIAPSTTATPSVITDADQIYYAKLILKKDTVLKSNTLGNIEFHNTVDSFDAVTPYSLTVNTGGNTVFGDGDADYVGQTFALSSLTTDAAGFTYFNITPTSTAAPSVTTTTDQIYNDKVRLRKDTVLKSSLTGNIEFHNTVDSFDDLTHYSLAVNTAGNSVFGDGDADYVGKTFALSKLTTDATGNTYFNITPSADATPTVTTDTDQTYGDSVGLRQDTVLKSTTSGKIEFDGTVDSFDDLTHYSLTLNTAGNSVFGDGDADYVGKTFALSKLTTDATGTTYFNIAPSATATPSVTTDTDQIYNDKVALQKDTVLKSTTTGNVEFHNTVDSFDDTTHYALTVNTAGLTRLGDGDADYIGKTFALAKLTTDAPGSTYVNITPSADATPSVTTDTDQIYNDKVLLQKDTVLKSTTNGNIEFHDTVDSFDNTTHYFLTVNTGGNTVFGDGGADYVGKTFALSKLTTDAGGFTYLNITPSADATPSVTTDSDQDYKDQVLLQQDTALKATTGNLTFEDTVDSATTAALKTLRLFADPTTGVIEFKKSVGTTAPIGTTANLPALTVTSGKEVKFDATATDVKLSGAFSIEVAGINVHGATPKTRIIGVRAGQNVVEITKSSVTLQDLEITDDDATRTTGNGIVVASSPVGTTLTGTILKNLAVHDHPDNGVVLTNVSGTQVTGSDIYDNTKDGVRIETSQGKTGNLFQKNTIHDNTLNGIYIATASDVLIGDATDATLSNEIYANTKNGIAIAADSGNIKNRIQLNSMHDNTGLGVDLNDDGRTANDKTDTATSDTDTGANNLQNTPEILYSFKFQDPSDGLYKLAILYHVPSASSGGPFTVNFYLADAGHQEGLTPLTTDTYSDAALKSKLFKLTISLADFNDPDKYVQGRTIFVATSTDTAGNTSEFSLPAALNITPDAIINPNAARLDTQIDPNPAINDIDIDGNTHVDITQLTTAEAVNAAPAVRSNRTDYFGAVAPQDDTDVIWTITSKSDTTSLINVGGLYQIDNPASPNDAPTGAVTNGGPAVSPSSDSLYAQKAIASKSSLDIAYSADPTLLGAYVVRATAGVSLSPDPLVTNPTNKLLMNTYQTAGGVITSVDAPTEAFFSFPAANPDAAQAVSQLQTGYDASGKPIIGNTPTAFSNMGAGAVFNHLGKIYLRLEDGAIILPWEDNTKSTADAIRVTNADNLRDNSQDGHLSFPGGTGTDHLVFGDFNDAVFTISNDALKPIGARAALTVSFPAYTPEGTTGISLLSLTVDPPAQDPVTVEDNPGTDSNPGDDSDSGFIPVIGSGGSNTNGTGGTTINGTAGSGSTGGTSDSTDTGSDTPETGKKKKHERVKAPKTSHHKEHPVKVSDLKNRKGK